MLKVHSCTAETHHPLMPIISPILFTTWGMHILGLFPTATCQHKYLFVVVDYFTKWIEAEVVASITATEVRKFILKNNITILSSPEQ